jgi:hypothetical protein
MWRSSTLSCNETKKPAEARRIFDRIRKPAMRFLPVAEQAFHNIDRPLRDGINAGSARSNSLRQRQRPSGSGAWLSSAMRRAAQHYLKA